MKRERKKESQQNHSSECGFVVVYLYRVPPLSTTTTIRIYSWMALLFSIDSFHILFTNERTHQANEEKR